MTIGSDYSEIHAERPDCPARPRVCARRRLRQRSTTTSRLGGGRGRGDRPGERPVLIALETDPDSDQWQQADELLSKFPGKARLLAEVRDGLADEGVDLDDDVAPGARRRDVPRRARPRGRRRQRRRPDEAARRGEAEELLQEADDDTVTREIDGWTRDLRERGDPGPVRRSRREARGRGLVRRGAGAGRGGRARDLLRERRPDRRRDAEVAAGGLRRLRAGDAALRGGHDDRGRRRVPDGLRRQERRREAGPRRRIPPLRGALRRLRLHRLAGLRHRRPRPLAAASLCARLGRDPGRRGRARRQLRRDSRSLRRRPRALSPAGGADPRDHAPPRSRGRREEPRHAGQPGREARPQLRRRGAADHRGRHRGA